MTLITKRLMYTYSFIIMMSVMHIICNITKHTLKFIFYSSIKDFKMTLCVHSLMLRADAAVLLDDTVKMLYVEFRFLDYPLEELETPFSLPKVASPNIIQYNFEKGKCKFYVCVNNKLIYFF